MSLHSATIYTMTCDYPSCRAESGNVETEATISDLNEEGWLITGAYDFCPEHAEYGEAWVRDIE